MSSTESGMLSRQGGVGAIDVKNGAGKSNKQIIASKLGEIILGGQDGLVNVAGVILGLAAATDEVRIIIAGGLAATFAESISMAAVAYTSKLADKDYYDAETARGVAEVRQTPESKMDRHGRPHHDRRRTLGRDNDGP